CEPSRLCWQLVVTRKAAKARKDAMVLTIQQKGVTMRQVHIRSLRFVVAVAFALALHCAVLAQSSPVAYQVALDKNPTTHFLHVSLQVNSGSAASIDVAMPACSPGAYGIRNDWRNVRELSATD